MKYFSIPEPCSENWNEMTPNEKGAFCQKCSNDVYDVSNMSNSEIIQMISSEKNVPCMRMKPSQERTLNTDLGILYQSQKRNMQRAMLFSLLVVFGFTLFSCNDSQHIYERNLLETAAQTLVDTTETTESKAQELNTVKTLKNDDAELNLEIKELENVKHIELSEELVLLGEPVMYQEKIIEECVIEGVRAERLIQHTMGAPRLSYHKEFTQVMEVAEKEEYSTVFLNVPETFSALTFPNPATTYTVLKVELPGNTENLGVRLLDLNGKILQDINDTPADAGTHEFRIELLDLKPAYYLIEVRYNEKHEVVRLSKAQ
jgi:hypothetical protein